MEVTRSVWFWLSLGFLLIMAVCIAMGSAYPYIQAGGSINQTECYDFTTVFGWGEYAGMYAHWMFWADEGTGATPDMIININDIGHMHGICVDDDFLVGNWYRYTGGVELRHENTFVFRVFPAAPGKTLAKPNVTVTPKETITIENVTTISQPTVVITLPSQTPTPKVTAKILTMVTTSAFPEIPKGLPTVKGLPLPPIIGIIALVIAIFLMRE